MYFKFLTQVSHIVSMTAIRGNFILITFIRFWMAQGKVTQVAIYTRDVTDFKLTQARIEQRTAELIESEEKYRTLVENLPLVVYRMESGGKIVFINSSVEEIFGYSLTEIFKRPELWTEIIHNEDRARVEKFRYESFREGKEFLAEYRVKHKNGHIVYVADHGIPVKNFHDVISSLDGIIMDMTDRKKMQEELVRAEELKTISEISARLAHEIRNPLVSVGGFARRLLSSLSQDDPNRAKVEIIVKEAGRLETILRMILNYIHPLELHMSPTDPTQLIERVLDALDTEFKERELKVHLQLDPDIPEITVDSMQMELVLETLAKQALNQMEEGATLFIATHRENDMLRLMIRYPVRHISPERC